MFKISKYSFTKINTWSQKILKTQKNNVINKYRYWYPCFIYLRKICYNKCKFILKRRKFGLIFFIFFFFPLKTFCSNLIANVRFLRVFVSFYIVYGVWLYIIDLHAMENRPPRKFSSLTLSNVNVNRIQTISIVLSNQLFGAPVS